MKARFLLAMTVTGFAFACLASPDGAGAESKAKKARRIRENAVFVEQAYQEILKRDPDPEGQAYYNSRLNKKKMKREDVENALLDGKANEAFLKSQYKEILGREPDPQGMNDYMRGLNTGKLSKVDVRRALANSPEAQGKWLEEIYRQLLGREPDPSGIATYLGGLKSGKLTHGQIIDAIMSSPEFRGRGTRKPSDGANGPAAENPAATPEAPNGPIPRAGSDPGPGPSSPPADAPGDGSLGELTGAIGDTPIGDPGSSGPGDGAPPSEPSNDRSAALPPPLASVPDLPEYRNAKIDTSSVEKAIISTATYVKEHYPEVMPRGDDRAQCYKMMTVVIGILRANGYDAHRVVNHPSFPKTNPVRWGGDAAVVNGVIYDVYGAVGEASRPQALNQGPYAPGRIRE